MDIFITITSGFLILIASLYAIGAIDRGDCKLSVLTYTLSAVCGLMLLYYGALGQVDWLHAALALALALHLIPKVHELLTDPTEELEVRNGFID